MYYLPVNNFITGDSLGLLRYIPEGEVDLHYWDIPYNISNETKIFRDYRQANGKKKSANISFNFDANEEDEEEDKWDHDFDPIPSMDASIPSLHHTGSWIIWCAEQQYGILRKWAVERGFVPKQMIIWEKTNPLPEFRCVKRRQSTEIMIWIAKGKIGKKNPNFIFTTQEEMKNIIPAPVPSGPDRFHVNQKPLKVCKNIISAHCRPGGLVCDAFSGSGSIALSAYSLGRNFIAIDKKDKWRKIGEKRVKNYQIKIEEKTDKFEQMRF